MSYQCPIEVVQTDIQTEIESAILTTAQRVGIHVDKEELRKAISYDRNQYEKGYKDRDAEIVRCKDCWKREFDNCPFYEYSMLVQDDDFFCSDGERLESGNETD